MLVGASLQTYQVGVRFKALAEQVPMAHLDSRYTQVEFNHISVQVCGTKREGGDQDYVGFNTTTATTV